MANFRLKILNGISMESWEYLNEDVLKKKGHFLYIGGRNVQATTSTKFLVKYKFYGSSGDLIETNN